MTASNPTQTASNHAPVALVTGGSRGIGHAIVECLRRAGYRVAACATTQQGIRASGADLPFVCDVTDPQAVALNIHNVVDSFGRLDAVVNNAGIAGSNPLEPDASDELWHSIINTNLNGTYYVCKHAMQHLPDTTGRIVNIASVLGLRGVPDQTAYCAAKHAVIGLTRALAHHLAPRQITVNAVCPGWVRTDMAAMRVAELQATEAQLAGAVPMKRFAEAAEIANSVRYLLSEHAAMVTGQCLSIDGGVTA